MSCRIVSRWSSALSAEGLRWVTALIVAGSCGWAQASWQVDARRMPASPSAVEAKDAVALSAMAVVPIVLPPWQNSKALAPDEGGVRQIGVARALDTLDTADKVARLLQWRALPSGQQVAALQWRADDAYGLRLGLEFAALPPMAVFRLYASPDAAASYEVTGAALLERLAADAQTGQRTWWTPDVGPTPVLEILLPAALATSSLQWAMPQLSQIVVPPQVAEALKTADMATLSEKRLSNACQQDVNCQTALLDQRDAVIRMVYVSQARTFQCTGTLLNNPRQDLTPYVLTAAHCVRDQATASTLQTSWFYYSQSCGSQQLFAGHAERYSAARWLATGIGNDMTLLQLDEAPPAGALFAGWDASTQPWGVAVAGLHHPRGDLMMLSSGKLQDDAVCAVDYVGRTLDCAPQAQADGGFYRVLWSQGGIEAGSSGSALFVNGRVTGTLTGGDNWCPAKDGRVVYGRLDQAIASFAAWLGADKAMNSDMHMPVYRFLVLRSGGEFYTLSASERDYVIASFPNELVFDGVAFYAAGRAHARLVPVHRYFNPEVVAHFYTTSDAERQFVQTYHPSWNYDGIAWWSPAQPGDGVEAVYRAYQYVPGVHLYSLQVQARDAWLANAGLLYDGLAYYVWDAP
ncbi:trypsin-like serine protease [Comamonas sp. B-9]|uniref:trypsin-like serine protease n=1 Tax=Comamonas sp. B-9 TaxID=1055192 RepID=UPI000395D22D|nr:trypsin-like serine protease [Comamonas sp. B-9]